jgi:C1A family cysteine protease
MAASATAQLTKEDIEQLQQQAIDEGWTFVVGENEATQYSLDQLCGVKVPDNWRATARFVDITTSRDLPESFDWRDVDGCTPIRNQGGCGSCWAFASVGALECNIKIRDGVSEDLSEQYLVSCNRDGWGCGGGWLAHDYFEWKADACGGVGAVMEADFPYAAADLPCGCPYNHPYTIEDWAFIGPQWGTPSVESMKQAIMDYGPISVIVCVNSAFQAYGGGVFNGCGCEDLNHAVVLVGWDDNQGTNGVWFMRNSWGPYWGEGGYMRIPYGCNVIGYGAAFVDYAGGASFTADTGLGWVPFDVQFTGYSSMEVESWSWSFGDGDSAFVQSPAHTYDLPGCYDVCLNVATNEGDTLCRTRYNCVAALADTLAGDTVYIDEDSVVQVTVRGINSTPVREVRIPVVYSGDLELTYDSFSTAGCRTETFEEQELIHIVPTSKKMTFRLRTSSLFTHPDLEPGEGDIIKLFFSIEGSPAIGQETVISLAGYSSGGTDRLPVFSGLIAEYEVETVSNPVAYSGCCLGLRANVDGDPLDAVDIADLVYLVDYMFSGGPEPECWREANVDGNLIGDLQETVDIADMVYLVDFMFNGGPEPPPCPTY